MNLYNQSKRYEHLRKMDEEDQPMLIAEIEELARLKKHFESQNERH